MVAAAETSLYDWMMIISVVLGYVDQVTDVLFVNVSRSTSLSTSLFAAIFIGFFALVSVGRAIAQGRGIVGAVLALTGTELAVRAWQAYHARDKETIQRWKEVADFIRIESILEGVPLVFLATVYLFQLADPCTLVTCDASELARSFPSYVMTLPLAPSISNADVLAIHGHAPRCSQLPLTGDGWFTLDLRAVNTTFLDRPASAFERVIEFQIHGSALYNITGAPSPSYSCAGFTARAPGSWSALIPEQITPSAAIPILSIFCGILCSAYHLSRTYAADDPASLWALPEAPASGRQGSRHSSAAAIALAASAADAQVHPASGGVPRRARSSLRQSLRVLRTTLSAAPQLGPVVAHHGAAFACFAADVAFIICLWCEVIHASLLVAPHLSLFGVQVVAVLVAAGLKAWLVVGRGRWPWIAAMGQMLWTVTPLRVTNPWTLRVAPRWGCYAAVAAGITVNGLMLVWATAAPATMARGGGYPWRISWGPLLVLWLQFAMHAALMRLAFWTHERALPARVAQQGCAVAAGECDSEDAAQAKDAALEEHGPVAVSVGGSADGCY